MGELQCPPVNFYSKFSTSFRSQLFLVMLFMVSIIGVALAYSPSANAAGEPILTTSDLYVERSGTRSYLSILDKETGRSTYDFRDIVRASPVCQYYSGLMNNFNTVMSGTGHYSLSRLQAPDVGHGDSVVKVSFSVGSQAQTVTNQNVEGEIISRLNPASSAYSAIIFFNESNQLTAWCYEYTSTAVWGSEGSTLGRSSYTPYDEQYMIFYSTFPIVYPPDWTPPPIPDEEIPPAEQLAWQPDLNLITATGYMAIIQDRNFNTFDPVPFTCEPDGLTPIQHYQLYAGEVGNQTLIAQGSINPTVAFSQALPQKADRYVFTSYYECPDWDAVFVNTSFLEFRINEWGGVEYDCDDSIEGWFCSMNGAISFGIISSSLNGLVGVVRNISMIDPSYCNVNWVNTIGFHDDIIGVQNMPGAVCDNVEPLYLEQNSPFHVVNYWLNIVLAGGSILFLVGGILNILGVPVKLASPVDEDETPQNGKLSGQGEGFGSRRSYVKGSGDGKRLR